MLLTKTGIRSAGALGMLLVAASVAQAGPKTPQGASAHSRMSTAQAQRLWAARSAHFVENKGQWSPQARFYAKGKGVDLWFTGNGIRFDQRRTHAATSGQAVDVAFVGGHGVHFAGRNADGTRQGVYRGKRAIENVRGYRELVSKGVFDGVDLRAYYDGQTPRYDLIVAPGRDASAIRLGFKGATGLAVRNGALKVGTKLGGFYNGKPFAYQNVDGQRRPVFAKWVVQNDHTAGFALGAYDHRRELVIDPVVFGTYFGGEDGNDEVRAAVADNDGSGATFIVGTTTSPDFPANYGPFNDSFNPAGRDAFIARISADAKSRDYAALFGSSGTDTAQYVKLDAEGNVWVAGTTSNGTGFFSPTYTTGTTAGNSFFVMRFARNPAEGQPPVVSPTSPQGIVAVFGMANNNKALSGFDLQPGAVGTIRFAFTGVTTDALPTTIVPNTTSVPPAVLTDLQKDTARTQGHLFEGHETGFLVRFAIDNASGEVTPDPTGSQYMEGVRVNDARGVALDANDNAYVVGTLYKDPNNLLNVDTSVGTNYRFFETTPNVLKTLGTTQNGYVTGRVQKATDVIVRKYLPFGITKTVSDADAQKVNPTMAFSGLLGGNGDDDAGGYSTSPSTPGVVVSGGRVLPVAQASRLYTGNAIAIDPPLSGIASPSLYITGTVNSSNNFPVTTGPKFTAVPDVFMAKISNDGGTIAYSTGLGVTANLVGVLAQQYYEPWIPTTVLPAGIAVDPNGYAFITGNLRAFSVTFPTTTPGTPNEPTASTLSAIPIPSPLPSDIADPTYDSPTGNELPTTEGFLFALTPLGNAVQYRTYVGGILDEIVFPPALTDTGNVIVPGWSDGARFYVRQAGTTIKTYPRFGVSLPNTPQQNITPGAVKANPHSGNLSFDILGYGLWITNGDQPNPLTITLNPNADGEGIGRDGLVMKYDVNLPQLQSITFSPTSTPDGYGASTTGTIALSRASAGNTSINLTITGGASAASFSPSGNVTTTTVSVPQGATSVTFPVYTKSLPDETAVPVTVSAKNASVTVNGSFTVIPWLQSVTLSKTSTTAGNGDAITGTVTLAAPATAGVVGAPIVLSVSPNPENAVQLGTLNIAVGSTTGTFTVTTLGIDSPTAASVNATISATLGAHVKSTDLAINRAKLATVTYSPSVVPAGSSTTGTITLDGKAGNAGLVVLVTGSPANATDLPKTVVIGAQQSSATFTVNTKFSANDPTTVTTTATPRAPTAYGPSATGSFLISKYAIVSLTFSPSALDPNTGDATKIQSTGTVTLNTAAPTATRIDLTITNYQKITVLSGLVQDGPGQYHLTIAAGATSASFTVKAANIGAQSSVGFTATRNGVTGDSASANLTIKALTFTVTLSPNTVIGSNSTTVTGTIKLTGKALEDYTFVQTSSDPTLVPIGSDGSPVTIAAGQQTATFLLHPGASRTPTSVVITSTVNGQSQSAALLIQPPSLIKVTPVQKTVRGGDYIDLDALFDSTPVAGTLDVSFSQSSLFTGGRQFSVSGNPTRIRLRTVRVSRGTNVTITVTYNIHQNPNDPTSDVIASSTASTTVTVAP